MAFEPAYKKPGDLILSDEWNRILEELVSLRNYVDSMTSPVTLTSLESMKGGTSYALDHKADEDLYFGTNIWGLITKQYYLGKKEMGDICMFGIDDYADVVYYWASAVNGNKDALEIVLEYTDGSRYKSPKLYVQEWKNYQEKDPRNPFVEYISLPKGVWYKYAFVNPYPDKVIRFITFRDVESETAVKIGNVLQYIRRIRPLPK